MKFTVGGANPSMGTCEASRPVLCRNLRRSHHCPRPTLPLRGVHPTWVASPAAPTPAAPAAMSPSNPGLTTEELCAQLAISRSTLFAIKRSGLLKPGRHLVPKNPGCRRSHLLWHLHRCELALGRQP